MEKPGKVQVVGITRVAAQLRFGIASLERFPEHGRHRSRLPSPSFPPR
jgi:hypothetical protein